MNSEALKEAKKKPRKNKKAHTSKKADNWKAIINNTGLLNNGKMVNILKMEHGLDHEIASTQLHHANKSHRGFANRNDLISLQYVRKGNPKNVHETSLGKGKTVGSDAEPVSKKAYVSPQQKRQFMGFLTV
jgi:hypothetical protein